MFEIIVRNKRRGVSLFSRLTRMKSICDRSVSSLKRKYMYVSTLGTNI